MFESSDRVYVDSNVLIYLIEAPPLWGEAARRLFEEASRAGAQLCTSDLTLAECYIRPRREANSALLGRYDALFYGGDELERVPLDLRLIEEVPAIAAECGLKLIDAIHVASAAAASCGVFVSSDLRLRVPAGMKLLRLPAG